MPIRGVWGLLSWLYVWCLFSLSVIVAMHSPSPFAIAPIIQKLQHSEQQHASQYNTDKYNIRLVRLFRIELGILNPNALKGVVRKRREGWKTLALYDNARK